MYSKESSLLELLLIQRAWLALSRLDSNSMPLAS
jgi:hypothetical protein